MVLLALWLAGCAPESQGTWLEGAGYGWDFFNHRVSHVEWGVSEEGGRASIIGGTSTTGTPASLPEGCEASTCQEFPFYDEADVHLRWGRASTRRAVFATGEVDLVATAEGETTSVTVPLPSRARGEATAVLQGLVLDTDFPLAGGDACYDPAYGWHVRRMAVALGDAVLADDGLGVTFEATAAFEAGNSLEDERECVDAVDTEAQVPVRLEVLVVAGRGATEAHDLAHGTTYAYGTRSEPEPQPAPDPADRPLTVADPSRSLVGWSRLDWRFHIDDPEDRGAYLRTLSFDAVAEEGWASGHATSYSPGTQLSGFDYLFEGTVRVVDVGADIQRGVAEERIPVELDDEGVPVVHKIALGDSP